VCTKALFGARSAYGSHDPRNAQKAAPSTARPTNMFPEKGRPPPGGEEARVVVYQPRGVGLIHPRLRPSTAYYTHDSAH
jgi:hypothetical protein